MNARVMVLGADGQLGRVVLNTAPSGTHVVGTDRQMVNVVDRSVVERMLGDEKPSVVINCAAFTRVDDAEVDSISAEAVNTTGAENVAIAAQSIGARLLHISTDYVFSGSAGAPYQPGDPTDPRNVYGRTKRDGEQRALAACENTVIVRTAWVHAGHGNNFVRTAVRVLRERGSMDVVDDQMGTPTRAQHLARALWLAVGQPALPRILHFTDAGVASWYDVAECVRETLLQAGEILPAARVSPLSTERVPRPAFRPRCAVLDKHSTWLQLGYTPPHWRVGVAESTRELI